MSSYNEFFKFLIAHGCRVERTGAGSCKMMIGPNGKRFPFHNHGAKKMPKGTQQCIKKQAGIE